MRGKKKGLIALSALFTLSLGGALAGCGGNAHDPQLVAGKDPTCTEAGYEQYYMCTHCDKMYSDEAGKNEISAPVVKPALGHDMSKHDGEQATCTHPGNVEYYTCSREPGVYYANEAGSQTLEEIGVTVDHDFSGEKDGVPYTRPAEDPTKDEFGRKPSWTCNMCGTMFGDAYGDKVVTEEDLRIDKIQETIEGDLSEDFYHEENAFVIGANNVREGGLGMVLNSTLAKDGVYFHLVVNHNTSAAEQSKWGSVKIYINARNTENKNLPGNAAVSEAQTICMNLGLNGSIGTHDAHTVKAHKTVTNEEGALTKYTTTWEIYCSYEKLAETNKSVLQYAFEKQEGKTVLKNGYNILVTTVGCFVNKDKADQFENNGTSVCMPIGDGDVQEAWYLWGKSGYFDWGDSEKYMIVTPEGFSENFQNLSKEYAVKVEASNATVSGLPEKIAVDGTLAGKVAAAEGYVFRGLQINGKTVETNEDGNFSVALAELVSWNTAEITVTPVVVKNETQTVAVTLNNKTKEGASPLANAEVVLSDDFGVLATASTDANGVVTFENLLCMDYNLSVEGYIAAEISVAKGTGTAQFDLIKLFAVASGENVLVNHLDKTITMSVPASVQDHKWRGDAEIVTDSALKTANIAFETTLKLSDVAGGWGFEACNQRLAVQLTESGKGFTFWMWRADGVDKGSVGAFNDKTFNDCYECTGFWGGDKEPTYAWIYTTAQSASGLNLRFIRNGDKLIAYAQHDTVWEKLGETACETADELQVKVLFAHASYELSATSFTDLGTYESEVLPVVGTAGHIAHFKNGNNYYLPDGTPTTAEAVKTEVEESNATVTLVLKGLDGNNVSVAEGAVVTVKSQYHNTTLTAGANGVLSGTLYAGTYTASLYGYKDATLTVEESGAVTLTMNATIAYASDNVVVNDTDKTILMSKPAGLEMQKWRGNAEIVTDGALAKANVVLATTVKISDTDGAWNGNSQNQRLAIQLTKGGKGFAFWMWKTPDASTTMGALTNDTFNNSWTWSDIIPGAQEKVYGWIYEAAASANGLNLRFVRLGGTLSVYAQKENDWVFLGNTLCDVNDELQVKVLFAHASYELSKISVTAATEEPSEATVTLALNGLDGNSVTVAEGTKVAVESEKYIGVLTAGANGVLSGTLYVGTYTASLYGYKDATLTVAASGAVTLIMNATIAHASDNVVVNDTDKTISMNKQAYQHAKWIGNAEIVTDSALKTANIVFETTLKLSDTAADWGGEAQNQRFAVQLTKGGKGFALWMWKTPTASTTMGALKAESFGNCFEWNEIIPGSQETVYGWVYDAATSASGLKLRFVRNGNKLIAYAQKEGEWEKLGETECATDDELQVKVLFAHASYELSDISVTEDTQQA